MSKELTEKWKNGELSSGYYYLTDGKETYIHECFNSIHKIVPSIFTFLAPVPSYEEYRELLDLNVYEKDRKKVMRLEDKVERLQEQLKEANEAIMSMVGNGPYKADEIGQEYLDKWGVK